MKDLLSFNGLSLIFVIHSHLGCLSFGSHFFPKGSFGTKPVLTTTCINLFAEVKIALIEDLVASNYSDFCSSLEHNLLNSCHSRATKACYFDLLAYAVALSHLILDHLANCLGGGCCKANFSTF